MKIKKTGFTLIEMLLVVVIIGVMGVIVTINFTKTLESTEQKKCDDFVTEVEDAACAFSGFANKDYTCNRNYCEPIPLSLLVSEGLIQSETDACTNKDIDLSKTVSVTWDNRGEKHCTYNGVKIYER